MNWFQVSVDEANSLRSLVTKKEAEIEKYKKYLEKAKTVSLCLAGMSSSYLCGCNAVSE